MKKILLIASLLLPSLAAADGHGENQVVLGHGGINIQGHVGINLSKDAVFKPFSISPDIWYGVNDKFTAGLVHSSMGSSGFWGTPGTSLCLAGAENGCAGVLPNVGLAARYSLTKGDLALAVDGGLMLGNVVVDAGDLNLAVKLGLLGNWNKDKISIIFNPQVWVHTLDRDLYADAFGLPLSFLYGATPELQIGLQTGLQSTLDGDFADFINVPLSVGGSYAVNPELAAFLTLSFPAFYNKAAEEVSFDARSLTLGVSYSM